MYFRFFHLLYLKLIFLDIFLKTFLILRLGERSFVTIIFGFFPFCKSAFRFKKFLLKFITFDIKVLGNFVCHIWNKLILLFTISENEENLITFYHHPPIHPNNKIVGHFEEGRFTSAFLKARFSFTN